MENPARNITDLDRSIAKRVRLARNLRGMSQTELGKTLGCTFQQVQKYERAVNRLGAGRLYQIAKLFRVPVGYFFEDLPDPSTGAPPPENELQALGQTRNGIELVRAVAGIHDPLVRREMVQLCQALAGAETMRAAA